MKRSQAHMITTHQATYTDKGCITDLLVLRFNTQFLQVAAKFSALNGETVLKFRVQWRRKMIIRTSIGQYLLRDMLRHNAIRRCLKILVHCVNVRK